MFQPSRDRGFFLHAGTNKRCAEEREDWIGKRFDQTVSGRLL